MVLVQTRFSLIFSFLFHSLLGPLSGLSVFFSALFKTMRVYLCSCLVLSKADDPLGTEIAATVGVTSGRMSNPAYQCTWAQAALFSPQFAALSLSLSLPLLPFPLLLFTFSLCTLSLSLTPCIPNAFFKMLSRLFSQWVAGSSEQVGSRQQLANRST